MHALLTMPIADLLHWGVGGLLAIALLAFLFQYLWPGVRQRMRLKRAVDKITALRAQGPVLQLDHLRETALTGRELIHCWNEFRDTLHGQKQANASGALEVVRWRATTTANSFFTEQALVDAPLRTEFYKHLPGILTGIGIIGTFSGLILGLQDFGQVDLGDADSARNGLRALLGTVGAAFVVSASAIGLAMVLTTIEKLVVNGLYTRVEALCGVIDSAFDTGAGEEYLQRLVDAAETSATQAMQMKESLVTDLKQVLTELTHQQISTITATSGQLGQAITRSLDEGLKEPLARISEAVHTVGNSQGEAVNKLLTDVLSSFAGQMEQMFGGQMRGMSDMLAQTAGTIQQASQRFEGLIDRMQQANSGASDAMARRMDEALAQMQARQAEADVQMRAFVEHLQRSVATGQTESGERSAALMKQLGDATSALLQGMQEQSKQAQADQSRAQAEAVEQMRAVVQQLQASSAKGHEDQAAATAKLLGDLGSANDASLRALEERAQAAQASSDQRHQALTAEMNDAMTRQSQQVARLTAAVQRTDAALQETVTKLTSSTQAHVDALASGAQRLLGAADRLGENLALMKGHIDGLQGSAGQLASASSALTVAANATQQALSEQKSVRDALAGMVADLRTTVEVAKRDASLTSNLVHGMQDAARRLSEAQSVSVVSLEQATQAIGDAHGEFAKQVESTLRDGNRVFHEELAQAVGLLRGAIQDLGDVLDQVPSSA